MKDQEKINILTKALEKIIEMNLQEAEDKYGNRAKAETWSCVKVAKEALNSIKI